MSSEVKWLYPGAEMEDQKEEPVTSQPDPASTSPSTDPSLPSPAQELPDLPDLSAAATAASNYVGSLWGWGAKKEANEAKEKVEARSAMSGGFGMMSAAFGKMPGFSKAAEKTEEEGEKKEEEEGEEKKQETKTTSYLASSLGAGLSSLKSSLTMENLYAATGATTATMQEEMEGVAVGEAREGVEGEEKEKEGAEDWGMSFSQAFSKVGKMTSDYTKVLQDTVAKAPLLADFNQEQDEFIRSKGGKEQESAPWTGYEGEEELRTTILALSEDRRNFLRAPPQGVEFDFEYSAVAAHAVVLLGEDPRLGQMRYDLVPKSVSEDDFWRNYFYRVGLAKQSFALREDSLPTGATTTPSLPRPVEEEQEHLATGEQEEEFLSEQQQASSRDLAEADAAMKKLGLTKNDAEWEAELEGELNEYEMVGGEEGEELSEAQIQALLEAEH